MPITTGSASYFRRSAATSTTTPSYCLLVWLPPPTIRPLLACLSVLFWATTTNPQQNEVHSTPLHSTLLFFDAPNHHPPSRQIPPPSLSPLLFHCSADLNSPCQEMGRGWRRLLGCSGRRNSPNYSPGISKRANHCSQTFKLPESVQLNKVFRFSSQ